MSFSRLADIGAKVAGVHKGRSADPHVDLGGAGLPQQLDNPGAGGAADDGVVHQHHPFALDRGLRALSLMRTAFSRCLGGLDEGAADVPVLDKADPIGDAGLAGIAQGRIQTGVGHADDHVRLDRVLQGQEGPSPLAGGMYAGPSMTESGRAK